MRTKLEQLLEQDAGLAVEAAERQRQLLGIARRSREFGAELRLIARTNQRLMDRHFDLAAECALARAPGRRRKMPGLLNSALPPAQRGRKPNFNPKNDVRNHDYFNLIKAELSAKLGSAASNEAAAREMHKRWYEAGHVSARASDATIKKITNHVDGMRRRLRRVTGNPRGNLQ